jgi:hypothetical protein
MRLLRLRHVLRLLWRDRAITFVVVAAVLLTAAVMACLGPAHRAASVADVTTALR